MTAKELLTSSGIRTFQELANLTGISKQRAEQIWKGKTGIGRKIGRQISERLQINMALLLSVEWQENGR